MRRIRVLTISALLIAVMTVGAVPPVFATAEYNYPIVPPSAGGPPGISGYEMDAIGRVLDTISSPARRDALAENWVQFAKQSITKSLDLGQQWVDVQKMQLRNQTETSQYQAEMLKLQVEIEQLRKQNLALENENLKMRLQLQQQSGPPPNAPASKAQTP